jgi:hypothetical protein
MMVADFGYQETAARTGIAYATIRKWSSRYHWSTPPNLKTPNPVTVTHVTQSPVNAHSEALRDLEGKTKLSLAKYAAKASLDAEKATLRDAPLVHKLAQTSGIVHNWSDKSNSGNTILNLAVLTGVNPGRSASDSQSDV